MIKDYSREGRELNEYFLFSKNVVASALFFYAMAIIDSANAAGKAGWGLFFFVVIIAGNPLSKTAKDALQRMPTRFVFIKAFPVFFSGGLLCGIAFGFIDESWLNIFNFANA